MSPNIHIIIFLCSEEPVLYEDDIKTISWQVTFTSQCPLHACVSLKQSFIVNNSNIKLFILPWFLENEISPPFYLCFLGNWNTVWKQQLRTQFSVSKRNLKQQNFKLKLKLLGFDFKGSSEIVIISAFVVKTGIELYKERFQHLHHPHTPLHHPIFSVLY